MIYMLVVFVGGGLLAPGLYWGAEFLARSFPDVWHHAFPRLADHPFHRFLDRALLGLALLGLPVVLRRAGVNSWRALGLSDRGAAARRLAIGWGIGLAAAMLVAAGTLWSGTRALNSAWTWQQAMAGMAGAAITAVLVSALEELLFRGALMGVLGRVFRGGLALCLSSAVFAEVHFLQRSEIVAPIHWYSGLELLMQMASGFSAGTPAIAAWLSLFLAGCALGLAYQRTGSLYLGFGMHAGWIFLTKIFGMATVAGAAAGGLKAGSLQLPSVGRWITLAVLGMLVWMFARMEPGTKGGLTSERT